MKRGIQSKSRVRRLALIGSIVVIVVVVKVLKKGESRAINDYCQEKKRKGTYDVDDIIGISS